jgi:uncharacterized protein (TIGR02246 family)
MATAGLYCFNLGNCNFVSFMCVARLGGPDRSSHFLSAYKEHLMKLFPLLALSGSMLLAGCSTNGGTSFSYGAPVISTTPATQATPGTRTETCRVTSEQEIAALFDRWNQSLQTGDPHKVVANYAERSILLPTVSNKPRLTAAEKEDYFHHFLENRPSGKIDLRRIDIDCNTALDAGLYTFTFAKTGAVVSGRYSYTYRWDGNKWLISSHHSSAMPEKK